MKEFRSRKPRQEIEKEINLARQFREHKQRIEKLLLMFDGRIVDQCDTTQRIDCILEAKEYLMMLLNGNAGGLKASTIAMLSERSGLSWASIVKASDEMVTDDQMVKMGLCWFLYGHVNATDEQYEEVIKEQAEKEVDDEWFGQTL